MSIAAFVLALTLIKRVDLAGPAARPEIIATADRVFVVYLEPAITGNSFRVTVYDRDLQNEIASRTLVATTPDHGSPTDIRIVSDGQYAYAFYETLNADKTYLWAAKYALTDGFGTAATTGPIATSTMFKKAKPGDEKLDDPAPMLANDDLYVMTRFKSTLARSGDTRYKLRRFDEQLHFLSDFVLDLNDYADGEARQSSILMDGGRYSIAMATTTGDGNIVDDVEWTAASDILVVELDDQFDVATTRVIAAENGYTEGYVTGLISDARYFYVTYCRVILDQEFSSVIKVFDKRWNAVGTEVYASLWGSAGKGGGLRPSLAISGDRVYAGNNSAIGRAEIYVFSQSMPGRRRIVTH